ncbi:MAG: cold shock domain-containing protein [Chitinophagaceae bacterium]
MAKSKETFNKKEKEKKRLKQKQEKEQKMEDRKSNAKKGKSLEEMMAYLDENGNLTDKPPDPRAVKKVFKQEDMQIGVPKQEDRVDVYRTGVINFFDKAKGFGFINDDETKERVFFHINNLEEQVNESDKVKFMVESGPRGLSAVQVSKAV